MISGRAMKIEGSLFLILYIQPIWFLEVGRSATSALRFGRTQIEVTDTIHRSVHKVANLLLDSYADDRFDGYLYELTQECFDQSWQWQASRTCLPGRDIHRFPGTQIDPVHDQPAGLRDCAR